MRLGWVRFVLTVLAVSWGSGWACAQAPPPGMEAQGLPPGVGVQGPGVYAPAGPELYAPPGQQVFPVEAHASADPTLFGDFLPRFAVRYDAGDSVGRREGLSTFQGFIPLLESTDGSSLFFGDLRALVLDEGQSFGLNLSGGYRTYVPELNRVLGAYGSYDYNDTGRSSFHQLAGGVEALGEVLDFRLNFYLPVGDDSHEVGSAFTPFTDQVFQGNLLLMGGGQTTRFFEETLPGFDLETGGRLWIGCVGEVRGYVGMYCYVPDSGDTICGPRVRLESRLADALALELSYQHDEIYESTVNFSVAIAFPSLSSRRPASRRTPPCTVRERMAESLERRSNIVVRNTSATTTVARTPVLDPLTGQPMFFLHVAPGGSGNGTFESPYGTLDGVVADPRFAQGNLIVYDQTTNFFTGNVTFAPGTRLLSSAPVQQVQTLNAGTVTLPGSGASPDLSAMPTIQGSVVVADNSTISGYNIFSGGGDPISAPAGSRLRNVVVTSNQLTGGSNGILFADVAGQVTVTNNRIFNATTSGVHLGVQSDESAALFVSNNTINATGQNAIDVAINTTGGSAAQVQATVTGNAIATASNNGIAFNIQQSGALTLNVDGNTATDTGANGLFLTNLPSGSATVVANVANNTFNNNSLDGIRFDITGAGSANVSATADQNTLVGNGSFGLNVTTDSSNVFTLSANDNTSDNGFFLNQMGSSVLNVIDFASLADRNGTTVTSQGTITDVPSQ